MKGRERFAYHAVAIIATFALISCIDADPTGNREEVRENATGRLRIEVFDSPLAVADPAASIPVEAQSVILALRGIALRDAETGAWDTIATPDARYDFLALINGATATLVDTFLTRAYYSEMRVLLADTNEIVVRGRRSPLVVPHGANGGIIVGRDIFIRPNRLVWLYVDFDLQRSIARSGTGYAIRPTVRAFPRDEAGTISGKITDGRGAAVPYATVRAVGADGNGTSTVTGMDGAFMLILEWGTYDLHATAAGRGVVDTSYADVVVVPGDHLTGFRFAIE